MAQAKEYARLGAEDLDWEREPWYGTPYKVERFDERFVQEVCSIFQCTKGPSYVCRHRAQMTSKNSIFLGPMNSFLPTLPSRNVK